MFAAQELDEPLWGAWALDVHGQCRSCPAVIHQNAPPAQTAATPQLPHAEEGGVDAAAAGAISAG